MHSQSDVRQDFGLIHPVELPDTHCPTGSFMQCRQPTSLSFHTAASTRQVKRMIAETKEVK
jgi:hypothetical protein